MGGHGRTGDSTRPAIPAGLLHPHRDQLLPPCHARTPLPAGVKVAPHFDAPFLATSLSDFWSHRWDLVAGNQLRNCVYAPIVEGVLLPARLSGFSSHHRWRGKQESRKPAAQLVEGARCALGCAACALPASLGLGGWQPAAHLCVPIVGGALLRCRLNHFPVPAWMEPLQACPKCCSAAHLPRLALQAV